MSWFNVLKNRQFPRDIQAGEPYDRARFNYRGNPQDAANRGGFTDTSNPIQESYESLNYREHTGPFFGAINRMTGKHEQWATRDKKNTSKHKAWAQILRDYNSSVKQMIVDSEKKDTMENVGPNSQGKQ